MRRKRAPRALKLVASVAEEPASGREAAPLLLILAGPNGAGKSTFHEVYVKGLLDVPFVNADHIARSAERGQK